MPAVLAALAIMLRLCFRMHDTVFSNLAANEAVELYSHMREQDAGRIEQYVMERLEHTVYGGNYEITLESLFDGYRAVLRSGNGEKQLKDSRIRPERFMRVITLTEVIP